MDIVKLYQRGTLWKNVATRIEGALLTKDHKLLPVKVLKF